MAPFVPVSPGTVAKPFTVYYRDGSVIRTLSSIGDEEAGLLLDPVAEFGLYMPPEDYFREWGAVSPDGTTLALILSESAEPEEGQIGDYTANIYLFDQTARELRLLASDGYVPQWSPNGQRLAYASGETGGLWVAEIENSMSAEVYAVDRSDMGHPHNIDSYTWAPDSRRLAVVDGVGYESTELLIVDADREFAPNLC